ncbi:hypothetical protein PMAYCL1PPCAC_15491, partial [Pristionchus mayeri]
IYRVLFAPANGEWLAVGRVGTLHIYPVKSCYRKEVNFNLSLNLSKRLKNVDFLHCRDGGVSHGEHFDRQFVVIDEDSEMMCTARQIPKLAILKVDVCARFLTVTTPEGAKATVNLEEVVEKKEWRNAILRKGQSSMGLDCGEEIADLLNQYCQSIYGVRMLYYPPTNKSKVDLLSWIWKLIGSRNPVRSFLSELRTSSSKLQSPKPDKFKVSYVEKSPFYVITESSLASLNERLDRPVTAANFRPNIVIEGNTAWDEDRWAQVKFGDETVLNCDQLCTRCTVTTVDPENGTKDAAMEPVKTMRDFRPVPDGRFVNGRTGPVFGINASLEAPGLIRKGQIVYVKYK